MEGGTLARGRDSASSSFRLRVMMFLKWRRASCRTDGSFPWRRAQTRVRAPTLPAAEDGACRSTRLYGVEDGLQHGQNIAEEEVPRVRQRVQQLLTCGADVRRTPSLNQSTHRTFTAELEFASGHFKVVTTAPRASVDYFSLTWRSTSCLLSVTFMAESQSVRGRARVHMLFKSASHKGGDRGTFEYLCLCQKNILQLNP